MKRLIAIFVSLQIFLSPFCVVLAMETNHLAAKPPCPSVEMGSDHASSHVQKHLICCETRTSEHPSTAQTSPSTNVLPSLLHTTVYSQPVEMHLTPAGIRTEACTHPPEDFERMSQSKRE